MSFIADLRQRRIIQIFIAYMAGGWIALEAIDQLVNNEIIPILVYQIALVVFLAGVPASLVIGWYHGEKGHQKAQKFEVFLLACLGIVAMAGVWRVIDRARTQEAFASASELNTHSLAIMYLATGDEELRPVADGLTEALISQFERVASLDVVSENGVAQFRDSDLEPDSIARILDVGTIIEGSIERRGDGLRATLELIDGGSGMRFNEGQFDWSLEDVLGAQDELAAQVSVLLRDWLGEEVGLRASRRQTESVSAWLLVQQAQRRLRLADESVAHGDVEAGRVELVAADSLAGEAARADSVWSAPRLQQARVDYRLARTYDNEPLIAERHHQDALAHLEDALRLDNRRGAEAFELRGRVNYVRYLLGLETDHDRAEALLTSAEEDLRQATTIDPRLASAFSLLAHLANQRDDIQGANLAARQAYDADAFLDEADVILWRLFHTSYDLENFTQARSWCLEGAARFPEDPVFRECQLWLMTAGALDAEVDIDAAWNLHAAIVGGAEDHASEFDDLNARILVAGAIARAGLADSAVAVLDASRGNPRIDPRRELLLRQAFVYATILDEPDTAISLLREYLTANPDRLAGFREHGHWWWRDLRGEPAFRQLVGG